MFWIQLYCWLDPMWKWWSRVFELGTWLWGPFSSFSKSHGFRRSRWSPLSELKSLSHYISLHFTCARPCHLNESGTAPEERTSKGGVELTRPYSIDIQRAWRLTHIWRQRSHFGLQLCARFRLRTLRQVVYHSRIHGLLWESKIKGGAWANCTILVDGSTTRYDAGSPIAPRSSVRSRFEARTWAFRRVGILLGDWPTSISIWRGCKRTLHESIPNQLPPYASIISVWSPPCQYADRIWLLSTRRRKRAAKQFFVAGLFHCYL